MKLTPLFLILLLIFIGCLFVVLSTNTEAKQPHGYYIASIDTVVAVDGDASNPVNLSILYINDTVHGWGQIQRIGKNQFRVDAHLRIGNATSANTTYFLSKDEMILIEKRLDVTTYATAVFGEWGQKGSPHASNGSFVKLNMTCTSTRTYYVNGSMYVYGSIFSCKIPYVHPNTIQYYFATSSIGVLNESRFEGFVRIRFYNTNSMVYNCYLTYSRGGWNTMVKSDHIWMYVNSEGQTFSNAIVRITEWYVNAYGYSIGNRFGIAHAGAGIMELINPVNISSYGTIYSLCYIDFGAGDDHYIRMNYTLDLKVTDETGSGLNNAQVRIWNKTGNLDYTLTTNTGGYIPQTMLPYMKCFRPNANGITTKNTTYTPYRIIINKTGYQDYNLTFNRSYPLNWTIALQPEVTSSSTSSPQVLSRDTGTTMLAVGLLIGIVVGPVCIKLKLKRRRK